MTELEEARTTIAQLTLALDTESERFVGVAGLSRSEAVIVGVLARGEKTSFETLKNALYAHKGEPANAIICLRVFVHKIRKKLGPHSVHVQALWAHGYEMAPESIRRLEELVA